MKIFKNNFLIKNRNNINLNLQNAINLISNILKNLKFLINKNIQNKIHLIYLKAYLDY